MVANFILDTIIFVINNTILRILPVEVSGLSINQFSTYMEGITNTLATSFNFINNFVDVKLLFLLLAFIIIAEVLLHFGFKSVKYIVNLFRGSGG